MRYSKKFKSSSSDSQALRVTWEDDWENVEIFFNGASVFKTKDLKLQKGASTFTIAELGQLQVAYNEERKDISIEVGGDQYEMDSIHTWNNLQGLSSLFVLIGGAMLLYASFLIVKFQSNVYGFLLIAATSINVIAFLTAAVQIRKGKYLMFFIAFGALSLSIPLAITEIYYFQIRNLVSILIIAFVRPFLLVVLLSQVSRVTKAMKTGVTIQDDELLDV